MAGKRMIHANICDSEKLAAVSYPAEVLYYRLLTRVDDNGNFHADPRIIRGQCMTLRDDMTSEMVGHLLEELSTVSGNDKKPLIEFYDVNGDQWLHITRFGEFQTLRSDRPATVRFPNHPPEMGPTIPNSMINKRFTNGISDDNQTDTNGNTSGGVGLAKIREVKVSKEKESEEKPSFSSGTWKTLAIRFRGVLGKFISSTKTNKQKYSEFCSQYGEDRVLEVFNQWADQNKGWVADKSDALFFFWKELPDMVEAESSAQKSQEPEIPEEQVAAAIMQQSSDRQKEIARELEELASAKKWEQDHKDEI